MTKDEFVAELRPKTNREILIVLAERMHRVCELVEEHETFRQNHLLEHAFKRGQVTIVVAVASAVGATVASIATVLLPRLLGG